MRAYLKIKVVSLAAEARLIRKEEKRHRGTSPTRFGLWHHRTEVVRPEARCANLAYGFLRGRPYFAMEKTCNTAPNWDRILKLAIRYGDAPEAEIRARFDAWRLGLDEEQVVAKAA